MSLLGTPIKIGYLDVANRLVMPPMATEKAQGDGEVTQALCDYYAEKSAGGFIWLNYFGAQLYQSRRKSQ